MKPDERIPRGDEHSCSADVAAYALGALEPAEAEAFRHHLETCAICPQELHAFQQVLDDVATGVPRVDAPPDLRHRVLRAIEEEPRIDGAPSDRQPVDPHSARQRRRDAVPGGRSWLRGPTLVLGTGIAFALAAIVVVLIAFPGRQSTRTITANTNIGGTATLHISPHRTELVLRHVARPPHGKLYEVWLQYGKGKPRPDALFGVDDDGDASVVVSGTMYGVSQLMVTVEPAPRGTRTPTGAPVINASPS